MRFQPTTLLVFFLTAFWLSGAAFAGPDSTSFPLDQPIESRMDLGLFGVLGGGMNYSVGGKPIRRYEDFQNLIYPLKDTEASDLLREAGELHFAAWMLYVSGAAVGVDVGLSFKPVHLLGVDWFDRIVTGVVASEVPWGIGALLDGSAEGHKFNAVERYNDVIFEKKGRASLDLKPQLTLAQDGPRLGLGCSF